MPDPPRTSAFVSVTRSSELQQALASTICSASTATGILITLALLNTSSARTAASSPVARCFTQMPGPRRDVRQLGVEQRLQ